MRLGCCFFCVGLGTNHTKARLLDASIFGASLAVDAHYHPGLRVSRADRTPPSWYPPHLARLLGVAIIVGPSMSCPWRSPSYRYPRDDQRMKDFAGGGGGGSRLPHHSSTAWCSQHIRICSECLLFLWSAMLHAVNHCSACTTNRHVSHIQLSMEEGIALFLL